MSRVTLALGAIIHELAQVANIVTVNAHLLEQEVRQGPMREVVVDLQAASLRLPALMERLRAL